MEASTRKAGREAVSGDSELERPSLLCEVSWEVCRQVGGIYTVIRSKAPAIVDRWGDRYVAIGPYDEANLPAEFEEMAPAGIFGAAVCRLQEQGLSARFGKWLIAGQPQAVLFDPRSAMVRLAEIKYRFWEHHRFSLPPCDELMDSVAAFGYMVEMFFRELVKLQPDGPVIAHFHEWMAGAAIPELRRDNVPVSIVFTTHATLLGRCLAMSDPWFYDHLPFVDWAGDARRFNIEPQVYIERAAAHGAHVFTTLSDITAYECQHLIGRPADLLLPNGLNIERFVAMHEFQNLHREYKHRINQFVMGHFFPKYNFDLDKTLYFFTSGRYEYRNKGFDLTIEAMARLNAVMRDEDIDRTIVFFLVSRRPFKSINAEVLNSHAQMEEIRKACEAMKDQVGRAAVPGYHDGPKPSP